MNFSTTDLLPKMPRISMRTAIFNIPLTPFFNDPAMTANVRSRGFHGSPFFRQNKNTRAFDENSVLTDEPICGFDAYRQSSSVDYNENNTNPWTGTLIRSYVFNTDNNTLTVATEEIGKHTIGLTHTRTATHSYQGNRFNDPPTHTEITLSEPLTKDWLQGELTRWLGMPDEFIQATGSGLGTYSYIGQGATSSESDGSLAIVGGGRCRAQGPWFSGTPFGMVGNQGDLWNGNFSTWVRRVVRKNAPTLHQESGTLSNGAVAVGSSNLAVGRSIYRQGYSETELSEAVGHLWRDNHGVFEDATILDGFPMSAAHAYDFASLLQYYRQGEANELTLISRTGKRYRVTLQAGYTNYEYDEDDWEAEPDVTWVTAQTFVLTTNDSLVASTSIGELENAWDVRVARIEEQVVVEGQTQWKIVADADGYQEYLEDLQEWQVAWSVWDAAGRVGNAPVKPPVMRDPQQFIGSNILGDFLLLAAIKRRRGSRFGFYPLVYSQDTLNDRYRKKTFRLHLTPGTVNPHGGECGLGDLSGSADFEYSEEYDIQFGIALPRVVHQWSLTLNGVNWTQESTFDFEFIAFPGSNWVEQSATRQRREGTHTWTGRFIVAFDAPDTRGKLISTDWVSAGMSVNVNVNQTSPINLNPPSSGHSQFFEGHRLTYTA